MEKYSNSPDAFHAGKHLIALLLSLLEAWHDETISISDWRIPCNALTAVKNTQIQLFSVRRQEGN